MSEVAVSSPSHRSVFDPVALGPLRLRNRVVKAATFEGMTPDGLVSDGLIDYLRRPAAGGVGAVTLAYCAVSADGRTYRDQIWMRPEAVPGLRRLTEAVHAEGAAAAVQLGHAGYFANPKAIRQQAVGPSRVFSVYGLAFPRAATVTDLDRLIDDYRRSARLAVESGFDALEIHMGHGYLLSQFLSPFTNRRIDAYGGTIENRARFLRHVARAVRDEIGDRAAIWAKLNMDDGFEGGLVADDGVEVARMLDTDGALDALQLTGGFTSKSPMYLMRGEVPLEEMIELEPDLIRKIGLSVVGRQMLTAYPFEEAFFLPLARRVREAVGLPLMLLGGITRLETMQSAITDEGFEFVAMARALLREPDLVVRMARGETEASLCIPCNRCVTEMDRQGTRCIHAQTT